MSTALLELVGFPVLREGNIIWLPSGPLDVAEACSGIRSLLSLVTLAVIYGYLMETRTWVRVVLVCLAVPIAVVANSFRIFSTGLLMEFGYKDVTEGVSHALAGVLVFAMALTMLVVVHRLISLVWKSGSAVRREVAHPQEQTATGMRVKIESFRLGIVAVPMLAAAIFLLFHRSGDDKHVGTLPSQIGD
jgi:exosortase/archaeosortase family protein